MPESIAELLVLAGLAMGLYILLRPVQRKIEKWLLRVFGGKSRTHARIIDLPPRDN